MKLNSLRPGFATVGGATVREIWALLYRHFQRKLIVSPTNKWGRRERRGPLFAFVGGPRVPPPPAPVDRPHFAWNSGNEKRRRQIHLDKGVKTTERERGTTHINCVRIPLITVGQMTATRDSNVKCFFQRNATTTFNISASMYVVL